MGLREKALEFYETRSEKSDLSLSPVENIKPNTNAAEAEFDEWEREALNEVKQAGKISTHELIQVNPDYPILSDTSADPFLLNSDRQKMTQPSNTGAALHNRVEALLNLIELCKEIGFVDDEEGLWSTVIYSLLGQIGSREAAVFLNNGDQLELKADRGFIIDPHFQLPGQSGIYRILVKDPSLFYVKDVLDKVVTEEQTWLKALNAELIIPIMRYEEVSGFIILGKPIGSSDYHVDDLLYLKLFGEILGSFFDSINRILYISEQKRKWQEREVRHEHYLNYLDRLNRLKDLEEATADFNNILKEGFSLNFYTFLFSEEGQTFKPYLSKGLKQQTIDNFEVPIHEPWLWESKHHHTWYNFVDFKENTALTKRFSQDDLSTIQSMYLLPLFYEKEMRGLFIIYEVNKTLTKEDLKYLKALLFGHFLRKIALDFSEKLKENNSSAAIDPLASLKTFHSKFENRLQEEKVPYSCISIQVSNAGRLVKLLGSDKYNEIKASIKGLLAKETAAGDFIAEIFPSQFLLISKGCKRDDAWGLTKVLQNSMNQAYAKGDVRPLFRNKVLSRPEDDFSDLSDFLFD